MRQVHIIHVKKCASAKHDKDRHWSDLRELASTSLLIRTPPMNACSSIIGLVWYLYFTCIKLFQYLLQRRMTPTQLLIRTPQILVRLSSPQITWLS